MLTITVANIFCEELIDTREGEDLTLKCRFSEHPPDKGFSHYWTRITPRTNGDPVAIEGNVYNLNYK